MHDLQKNWEILFTLASTFFRYQAMGRRLLGVIHLVPATLYIKNKYNSKVSIVGIFEDRKVEDFEISGSNIRRQVRPK